MDRPPDDRPPRPPVAARCRRCGWHWAALLDRRHPADHPVVRCARCRFVFAPPEIEPDPC